MPPQTAYDQIEQLVRKFKALSPRERNAYNEAETRKSFILPLFRALEWNIDDAREVAAEEKISRGYVDFSFRLNGVRRFVLETKRIGEDLDDPRWAQQAIDYAYHKGVTWAVLSDFEGLKIFNAEAREQNPFQAQFKAFHVDDYLPCLDELWWLSRPAMIEGVLDREAEKVFKKIPRAPIAQALFDNLLEWRKELYAMLRAYNRDKLWTPKQIDDAVQRLLDRLIFTRTAEDRLMEDEKLIALVREHRLPDLIPALKRRFAELDAVYNSQLFRPDFVDTLELGEPSTIAKIIEGLDRSPKEMVRYNFALIDADVLGRVYEQYLGTVVSEREVEAKRAKRKAQGIYYTPTFVVKYIVEQTLGRYLAEHDYHPAHPVRVLDPACGSGSFLIEAFDVLDQHIARQRGQDRGAYDIHDYARQREILEQCIYGVDKDEQAVEVARLNLLLKALHLREKLPVLTNIRCGDSLISGTPTELEKYFGANWREKNPFNWEHEFDKVMAEGGFDVIVGNPPYVRQETLGEEFKAYAKDKFATYAGTADLYTYFIERAMSLLKPGGLFGFIVANKWMRANYGEPLRRWLKQQCIEEIIDFGDLPVFQQATTYPCILILRKDAPRQVFSVTNVETLEFNNLANYVSQYQRPMAQAALDDKGWSLAEERARRLLEKIRKVSVPLGEYVEGKIFFGIKTGLNKAFYIDAKTRAKLIAEDPRSKELIKPLVLGRDAGHYKPLSVSTYLILIPSGWTRKQKGKARDAWKWFERSYPAIARHLAPFATVAKKRQDQGEYWWELRACNYYPEFEKPKIIAPTIVNRASYSYDTAKLYSNDKTCIIPTDDLFLVGVINSKLSGFVMRQISSTKQGGYYEQKPMYIAQLPIRRINFDDPAEKQLHDEIVAYVNEMLELQKEYATAAREKFADKMDALKRRIDTVDAAIDAAVYRLYGLSAEEIQIVEQATGR